MAELTCPHCSAAVESSDVYCPNCTRALRLAPGFGSTSEAPPNVSNPPRTVAWIIGIGLFGLCALVGFPLLLVPAMHLRSQPFVSTGMAPAMAATATNCLTNIKQTSVACMIYQTDYDDHFPASAAYPSVLMPYTKNASVYECPQTRKQFALNSELLKKSATKVADPSKTVLFYEGTGKVLSGVHSGQSSVSFTDTHAKRVSTSQKLTWKP